ncbi:hypothetical protein [Bradyrhizobium sp.]|uniref:hypothetical protein n=1 Tax=Bradyrhizobium sp. TaxID=376 RepID=UPI0025B84A92|nr:hypothetical protein [Bradyrhizobium sp.]
MSAITNLLKSTAAIGAVALGLCFVASPASAEGKAAGSTWNASTFAAACQSSNRCIGGTGPGGSGYYGQINNDGKTTHVRCTTTRCTYDTRSDPTTGGGGGGGSPARVAAPDKTLGTGVGLSGLLAAQGASTPAKPSVPKTGPKVDTVYAPVDKPPKIEIARPAQVEPPKLTAVPAKDIKVNTIR